MILIMYRYLYVDKLQKIVIFWKFCSYNGIRKTLKLVQMFRLWRIWECFPVHFSNLNWGQRSVQNILDGILLMPPTWRQHSIGDEERKPLGKKNNQLSRRRWRFRDSVKIYVDTNWFSKTFVNFFKRYISLSMTKISFRKSIYMYLRCYPRGYI